MLFSSIGILVTYKCNAMCDSCGPRCGPHRKESLTVDEIKQLIDEAADCGCQLICFTGGEPTLLGPRLEEVIAYTTDKGIYTRIVSNGWWGKDADSARKRIKSFMAAGLTELNISADDWHLPYVPLERVRNAFEAARDLGLRVVVVVGETRSSKVTAEFLQDFIPGHPPLFNEMVDDPYKLTAGIRKSSIIPFGYGAEKIDRSEIMIRKNRDIDLKRYKQTGCPQALTAPAVLPDGRVTACCSIFNEDNHSLVMGKWPQQSLREILTVGEDDLLFNWIRLEGPYGIKDYIEKNAPEIAFAEGYAGICHLCGDLLSRPDTRKFLQEHLHELRDHVLMLRVQRMSGLDMQLGCLEARTSGSLAPAQLSR